MKKKIIKLTLFILAFGIVGYNSVYIKKLDEVKAASKGFDASDFARKFWQNKLRPALGKASDTEQLLTQLQQQKEKTFKEYGHSLGMGNIKYFLSKGKGVVQEVSENNVSIQVGPDTVRIATEYVFGNAVRDASGQINLSEFSNTMDLNNVSAELNKIIRSEVLPAFRKQVKKGDTVEFAGAIELNQKFPDMHSVEVMPIALRVVK